MEKAEGNTDTDTTDNNLSTAQEQQTTNRHGGEHRSGLSAGEKSSEKQEWSFTLYDLDGQGRVTKDEVAQLLKSLYDSVGSSISLPQTGTKNLKLLLTVTPDQTVDSQDKPAPESELPRDLNCKECNSDKDKMHCPKKDINSKLNNGAFVKLTPKDSTKDGGATISVQNNLSKAHRDKHVHSAVKRMSAIEQRQLAELVKFNMDKNKEKKSRHTESSRQRSGKNRQSLHLSHVLENPDRRSYYLDLAGIDNPSSVTLPLSPVTKDDTNARSQPKFRKSRSSTQRRNFEKALGRVHFSKDHFFDPDSVDKDTPDKQENVSPVRHSTPAKTPTPQGAVASGHLPTSAKTKPGTSHHKRGMSAPNKHCSSKSFPKKERTFATADERNEAEQERARERTAEQCTTSAERATETHKQRRQKQHREKNHLRAMMQVAQWIEREHAGESLGDVSVERHEHQHFHEHHHHHHYHHYYQT